MKRLLPVIAAFTALIFLTGCTTDAFTGERKASRAGVGAGVGAAIGAIGGAIIGGNNKRKAVLIGAGVGALTGAGVGAYMDAQERKLRRQLEGTGVSVTRDGDNIILNMPSNITFETDRAELNPGFNNILDSVVLVLNEYEKPMSTCWAIRIPLAPKTIICVSPSTGPKASATPFAPVT